MKEILKSGHTRTYSTETENSIKLVEPIHISLLIITIEFCKPCLSGWMFSCLFLTKIVVVMECCGNERIRWKGMKRRSQRPLLLPREKWKGRGPPPTKPEKMKESLNKNPYNEGMANKELHPPWAPTAVVFHWFRAVYEHLASATSFFVVTQPYYIPWTSSLVLQIHLLRCITSSSSPF